MSTRCNIEIRDDWYSQENKNCVLLYHHWDGYPENMVPLLKKGLSCFDDSGAQPYWWDSERVAAHFVANVDNTGGFPTFQPASCIHGDIEYYYILTLKHGEGGRSAVIEYEEYDEKKEKNVKRKTTIKIPV